MLKEHGANALLAKGLPEGIFVDANGGHGGRGVSGPTLFSDSWELVNVGESSEDVQASTGVESQSKRSP